MPRTESPIRVAFWLLIATYAIQLFFSVAFTVYSYGVLSDIGRFGWGKVPNENLRAYIWLGENIPPVSTFLSYLTVVLFVYLVYQTAALLDRLAVKKHLSSGMTAVSLFIPIYTFYRPWAGLGEVANTLAATEARSTIPYEGERGTNVGTVVLALAIYGYALAEKLLGVHIADIEKRDSSSEAASISIINDIASLFLLESIFTLVILGVVYWYWSRIIQQYHSALSLPNVSLEYQATPEVSATPSRDILQVGTRPTV